MSRKTIRELKNWFEQNPEVTKENLEQLSTDSRVGVRRLVEAYQRKRVREIKEQERLQNMWSWEKKYWKAGYQAIAGVDEAGRGPLAGPVVAAAVILPNDFDVTDLDDSKRLTVDKRFTLKKRIEQKAIRIGIGLIDARDIDKHNILKATKQAMQIAIHQCRPEVDFLLIDALRLSDVPIPQQAIVKGDQVSHSIAAASIIAKTTRDEWMEQAAKKYPMYQFEQHKGYGTAEHLEQLKQWGPSPIHRRSFAPLSEWFPRKSRENNGCEKTNRTDWRESSR